MKKILFLICLTTTLSHAQVPLNGLIAWYPFTGNANDSSGNNFHGSVSGAILTDDRFGRPNCAYNFDGINDKIDILNFTENPQTFTINLWFKASSDGTAGTREFLHRCQPGNRMNYTWNISWGRNTGNFVYTIFNTSLGTNNIESGNNLNTGIWYNITMSFDGTYEKIYIDGILTDSTDLSGATIDYTDKTGIYIGYDSQMDYYAGAIDDIRIYNRALTNDEVNLITKECPVARIPYSAGASRCDAGSVTLIADSGTTYNWYDALSGGNLVATGTPWVTPPLSDSTTFYLANFENGCESQKIAVDVYINPIPNVSFTGLDSFYCFNFRPDTLYGFPSGGSFYGSGINDEQFDPGNADTGLNAIVYYYQDIAGCTSTDTAYCIVDLCTSVNKYEANERNNLLVYPVPNKGLFKILMPEQEQSLVEIRSITGTIIYRKLYDNPDKIEFIDISEFPAGTYNILINCNRNKYNSSFSKIK